MQNIFPVSMWVHLGENDSDEPFYKFSLWNIQRAVMQILGCGARTINALK